jgi:cytochrome b561
MKRIAVLSAYASRDARVPTLDGPGGTVDGRQPAYTGVMQAMHWGTLMLLLFAYAIGWMIDSAANPADKAWLIMLHRSLGAAILLISGMRLVIRRRSRIPPLPPGLPTAQRVAARVAAIALYALLIVQPVLGLAASTLHGDRIVLFGALVLPMLLPVDRTLAHAVFQVHGALAWVFLALIGLHAAAGLYHHIVRKDHVLAAMLPGLHRMTGGTS